MAQSTKNTVSKTNVARLLDQAKIKYELVTYDVDPEHLEASHVADSLGEDIQQVFKTLVLQADKKNFVCVIPGDCEVDLKKAAKAVGAKKVELIPVKLLQPLTGYIRGGCSPIGMKKQFPTFFHHTLRNFDTIFVSGGIRGLQISINPLDLVEYVHGSILDLIKDS